MALVMFASKADRRPAREVGREPARELPEHDPRPRPRHVPRGRRQARRRGHRAAGQDLRQPRRPPLDDRPGHPDDALRPRPARAATRSRTSTARSPASTRTRRSSTRTAAPAGPRRPTSSSGRWTCSPTRSGWTGRRSGARTSFQPDAFPYDNPSGLLTASGGAKIYVDSGNYEPALNKALATAGYDQLDAKKAEAKSRGKLLGMGLSTYIEVCGVAPSKWIGAVGEGWGAAMWESANIRVHLTGKTVVTMGTQPQGQGHETTYAQIVAQRARHPDGGHRRPALGHAGHAVRLRLVRQPDLERGQHRGDQGRGQDQGQGPAVRGPHARGVARRHRDRRRRVPRQGLARQDEDPPGDRLRARPRVRRARGHGAVPRRDRLPRHAELHVPVRDPHRRRRDRRGDRQGRPRALRRRRRRRQEDQPDDRRRPAPRRHRPGRRPGALGAGHLQRRRPAADRAR